MAVSIGLPAASRRTGGNSSGDWPPAGGGARARSAITRGIVILLPPKTDLTAEAAEQRRGSFSAFLCVLCALCGSCYLSPIQTTAVGLRALTPSRLHVA